MISRYARKSGSVALIAALALVPAACSGDGDDGSGGAGDRRGGTLKYVGGDDIGDIDTASSYYTVASMVHRAFTRQLFSYEASNDMEVATRLVPDVAVRLPSKENGGISEDGLTYTIHLRDGVKWNTDPPREVTAEDFVRGIKRLCNPAKPNGAIGYYTSTIKGFAEFCDGFAEVEPEAGPIADYIRENDVEGMRAEDDKTLVFTLTQPANDFLEILGMTQASAAPEEYLKYVPASKEFDANTISNGPYQITEYTPAKSLRLERNPTWTKASDPLRNQYVDAIQVTMGVTEPDVVQQQLEAGTADLSWDQPVPTSRLAELLATDDPQLETYPSYSTNPYLVFNLQSPNEDGAMGKVEVRRAISYAIDKTQMVRVYGGPELNQVLNQAIPPGNIGHKPFNLYKTAGNKGDPAKCRSMLADAGYPNGLTLKAWYRNAGNHPAIAQSYQADLKECGINVKLIPIPGGDYYSEYLQQPSKAKAGEWDITAPGWIPDWFGNNGRAIIQPLFQTNCRVGTVNYGCYSNPEVDRLIDEALQAETEEQAAEIWHQIDRIVMEDAVIVPFKTEVAPIYRSKRVQNALWMPRERYYDMTQIWLEE